jgi:hypothetical protein
MATRGPERIAAARPHEEAKLGAVAHGQGRWYVRAMVLTLKGRVRAGKVVIDEALNLPEGSEVDLIVVDPGDDLDDERERLHAALAVAREEIERGEGVAAEDLVKALRRQHR